MPGPTPDTVDPSPSQPKTADAVIVGGGIIGASIALELAERGLSVTLCEKGVIAGEQSSRNWGWVRLSRRDPREIELMAASIRLWEGMAKRVNSDVGYRQCGIVVPFYSRSFKRENEAWLEHIKGTQHRVTALDHASVRALVPDMNLNHDGALYSTADGRAEPQKAAPAIARAAKAIGATILTNCAVTEIETGAGSVCGVVTEQGRIATQCVIVAGGAWSRLLLRGAGVTLPQLKVLNSVARTQPVEGGPDITVRGPGFSVRRRSDGGYTVSTLASNVYDLTPDSFRFLRPFLPALRLEWSSLRPRIGKRFIDEWRDMRPVKAGEASAFERTRILDPAPNTKMIDLAMARLAEAFPVFQGAEVAQRWAGYIDVTPDAVPVISSIDAISGLVVATGFSGHGFGLGPGAGRLAADLVTGAQPVVDPFAFRFSRFTDGSRIVPLTGV
ncbi:glycine/D-amino acid oxidase-like deaminating enzyme [Rhizobium sp. PP-F2F-G48]|uniref:NAD(P)/FAD-dependent oxidoreductase n=1 Tax=Rhizobium sp. PP-F2F-G48 TaxID=2135651 RepID=UPI0010430137|nr:FAD-binding oxidoreductase [Rhizobium sp. PP-F2F-G48]TCM48347.1 glycine/D-amino acid oxidase-like deaminating enzyme [Rhizobium sp. PP-F2F-G48]